MTERVHVVAQGVVASLLMADVRPAPEGPAQPVAADREVLNRIWSDVVRVYPFRSLTFQPDGAGATFSGVQSGQAVLVQPPLVKVQDLVELDLGAVVERIGFILKTVAGHLGDPRAKRLTLKLVYHVPAPGGHAASFLSSSMLHPKLDLAALAGRLRWDAGVRVALEDPEAKVAYLMTLEPLRRAPSNLFLQVEAVVAQPVEVGEVQERMFEVDNLVQAKVMPLLELRAEAWTALGQQ
ncbi:MAG TPA: hypothetical protein VKG45_13385 [Actinomycetes bacterium]|nr:hypothetical protein [Actinomycetes bacterium]